MKTFEDFLKKVFLFGKKVEAGTKITVELLGSMPTVEVIMEYVGDKGQIRKNMRSFAKKIESSLIKNFTNHSKGKFCAIFIRRLEPLKLKREEVFFSVVFRFQISYAQIRKLREERKLDQWPEIKLEKYNYFPEK